MTERLEEIDPGLYEEVKKILSINLSERHIRGGMATKNKYAMLRHTTEGATNGVE